MKLKKQNGSFELWSELGRSVIVAAKGTDVSNRVTVELAMYSGINHFQSAKHAFDALIDGWNKALKSYR